MRVLCFLKTPALEASIKDYLKKIYGGRQIYFEENKNFEDSISEKADTCVIFEDEERFEASQFQNSRGIFLFKEETVLVYQSAYPNFIFLRKPIKIALLLEKLGSLVREMDKKRLDSSTEKWWIGPFVFERSTRQLKHISQENPVFLTEKETELLNFLLNCPEGRAKRSEILENIWNYAPEIATRTLESHVYTLRKKMELDLRKPQYLLTEQGGYRLVYMKK